MVSESMFFSHVTELKLQSDKRINYRLGTSRLTLYLLYVIRLTPHRHRGFSVTDYIKYHVYLYYLFGYLAWTIYLYNNCDVTFLILFILTRPVNFLCGRKPEHPEKK